MTGDYPTPSRRATLALSERPGVGGRVQQFALRLQILGRLFFTLFRFRLFTLHLERNVLLEPESPERPRRGAFKAAHGRRRLARRRNGIDDECAEFLRQE